jgi:hypothetical protein
MSINIMAAKQKGASLDTQHIHTHDEIIATAVTCTSLVFLTLVTM